jgi:predicted aspartyl protease
MKWVGRVLVIGLFACGAGCNAIASPAKITLAIEALDLEALRRAADPDDPVERQFVSAVELAWLRRDSEAILELQKSMNTVKAPALRKQALEMLFEVLLRTGAYAEAAAVNVESGSIFTRSISAPPNQPDAAARGLAGVPPMSLSGQTRGLVPVKIDNVGLPRMTALFGGVQQEVVLDTGASLSAVSESAAARLGLRYLPEEVLVISSVGSSTGSRLAVADHLSIGETKFQHVLFAVIPDDAMAISRDKYHIDVILGLPIFLKLGRVAILPRDGQHVFVFGSSGLSASDRSNLLLNGLSLLATAILQTGEPVRINLLVDTGAVQTSFTDRLTPAIPDLVAAAAVVQSSPIGIGGGTRARPARRLGSLSLTVGDQDFSVTGADLFEGTRDSYHGILGQDVLSSGFVADFEAMTFELLALPTGTSQ